MKTDPERNPHFHRWDYRGNALQRRLKVGPRAAIYQPIASAHVVRALEEQDEDGLTAMKMAFAAGSQVWDGQKTVRPTRWWIEFAEGQLHVSLDKLYRSSPWAFRCIDILAKGLAQVPWQIVNAAEEAVESSPLLDLLTEVNPESNTGDLFAGTEADLNIYGRAYWLKIRAGPFLQRLNPKSVELIRGKSGLQGFRYAPGSGAPIEYPRQDVVYFHTYNPQDDLDGLSPLEICRAAVEIDANANSHMSDFFKNKAMPQFIFSMETTDQNELNRASQMWQKMYGGGGKQFQTAFIGGKGEPKEMGYAPDQLALKDVREEARKAICASLGVPPVLVGAWEAANYATAAEQRGGLYTEKLMPDGEYIASVINAELAPDFGDETFEWEWDQLDVLQEDENRKAERLALLVEKKILKPEVAADELGFDAEDVPEPAPVPEMLQPFVGGNNQQPKPPQDETFMEQAGKALRKWRKKAHRMLADGKPAVCDFESDYIPPLLAAAIKGQLETAETAEDVTSVFAQAEMRVA